MPTTARLVRPAPDRADRLHAERVRTELADWDRRWGRGWTRALESVARRASTAGIPVRVGSAAWLGSAVLQAWGWAGEPGPPARRSGSAGGRWILRVPPGQGDRVRAWLEEDAAAPERTGAPSVLVEESPLAFLPPCTDGSWPSAESWAHAGRLLSLPFSPCGALVPRSPEHLFRALCEGDALAGRRPVASDRAALLAWDLTCAAFARERAPAAWWLAARGSVGSRSGGSAVWRRAQDHGLRVLPPCVVHSAVCSRPQPGAAGRAVRLGLDELGPPASDMADALVHERTRGGPFRSRADLVRRMLRVGVSWRALLALAILGAMDTLPWRSPVRAGVGSKAVVSFPGTERRAVCRLSCLSP